MGRPRLVKVFSIAILLFLTVSLAPMGVFGVIEAEVLVNKPLNSYSVLQSGGKITLFPIITVPFKEGEDVGGWIEQFRSGELSSICKPPSRTAIMKYKDIDEHIKRQVFCKMRVVENYKEEFLKAAEVEYYDDAPIYSVLVHYVKGEDNKYYEEINGKIVAVIEPLPVTIVRIPISGTVPLGWGSWRGPFGPSVFQIVVSLQYTPTDHIVAIGLRNYDTYELLDYKVLTGGSGAVFFHDLDQNIRYAIGIINPMDGNTQAITYSGAIYIYYV